jgi:hypothetical protein
MQKALDNAERELRTQPILEGVYYQLCAACFALKGDATNAETSLAKARDVAAKVPYRSLLHEVHLMTGRAYLMLDRVNDAVRELQAAAQAALHPIEKHSTNYWLARALTSSGQTEEASKVYKAVVADGFNTWMSVDAQARLDPSQGQKLPESAPLVIKEL